MRRLFTSESVTKGHPDKVADAISDAVLDACLEQDPNSRVACEVQVAPNYVSVVGEITTTADFDLDSIVRETIKDIGYTRPSDGFSYDTVEIVNKLHTQSPDIAMGVDSARDSLNGELGAGDIGIMFGYAVRETRELMPAPIIYAHRLVHRMDLIRELGEIPAMRPDGKAQVTFEYKVDPESGREVPSRVDTVVICCSHEEFDSEEDREKFFQDIKDLVIYSVIDVEYVDDDTKIYINPTGNFVVHGPFGDSGLTGRKIVVDQYGGKAPVGGGALGGKDPTKVDRSATYAARWVAKSLVASNLCDEALVQLAYAIGRAEPVSVRVKTNGTSNGYTEEQLTAIVEEWFDLRPSSIIEDLELRIPMYSALSAYGQIGREGYPWERPLYIEHK